MRRKPWTKVGDILFDDAIIVVSHTNAVKVIPFKVNLKFVAMVRISRIDSPMKAGLTTDGFSHKCRAPAYKTDCLIHAHHRILTNSTKSNSQAVSISQRGTLENDISLQH